MKLSINQMNCFILNVIGILLVNIITLNLQSISTEAARTRLKNTLDIKYNLNCNLDQCTSKDPNKSAVNLFQVISSNPETTKKTNFIWSNIGGPPMVITTSSDQDSDLLVDWKSILGVSGSNDRLLNDQSTNSMTTPSNNSPPQPSPPSTNGLHFNVTQDSAIGILIEKIVFFNDTDNSGLFTKDKAHIEIDWGQVIWDMASRTTYQKGDFLTSFLRAKPPHKILGGDLKIKLAIPRNYKADRQQEVPHLKLNERSLSVGIIADGLKPPANFTHARLALTMVVVVQSPSDQVSLDTDSESLISDEYTPGVFRVKSLQFKAKNNNEQSAPKVDESSTNAYIEVEGQTPEAKLALGQSGVNQKGINLGNDASDDSKLGFLYWKEVAYTDRRKIISRTVDVSDQEISMPLETLPNISQPFYQYFKYQPTVGPKPQYKLYRFEMIFGKGESTYSSNDFTDFSFVLGLGAAPREQVFSFLVKFIIFICFCLPLLVMLSGLGYLMLRRIRRGGDTELLLTAES